MNENIFIALQRLAPQQTLSRVAGAIASSELSWLKNAFIRWFIQKYNVDMTQALEEDPFSFPSFNAFFTRALKPEARPIHSDPSGFAMPADGAISQLGQIQKGRVFQAKGQSFSVSELLGGDIDSEIYENGEFCTIYLSPRDYHRVHMPEKGTLRKMTHVPGKLFSVNQTTAEHVPRLFARNERVVCHFDTEHGPMVMVLVGAMIVASIETVWSGLVTPYKREIKTSHFGEQNIVQLDRGQEMGRFLLGSTAILLFPHNAVQWRQDLQAESLVTTGEHLGDWKI